MTDEEINQACAKALGPDFFGPRMLDFCNDHNAAAMIREEVVKRGLRDAFCGAIYVLLGVPPDAVACGWRLTPFALLNASPHIQAKCFLEVMNNE